MLCRSVNKHRLSQTDSKRIALFVPDGNKAEYKKLKSDKFNFKKSENVIWVVRDH